jgi:hypothetical protein
MPDVPEVPAAIPRKNVNPNQNKQREFMYGA